MPQLSARLRTMRLRRLGALLHHVAELAGEDELALARHELHLDAQGLAAHLRPGEAGGDAHLVLLFLARRTVQRGIPR